MNKFFSETLGLGPNWRTTLWGGLALICGTISLKPDLISFLPDAIEGYIVGISNFVTFVSGGAFVMNVKDKQVTGGVRPASDEAKKRISLDRVRRKNDMN